MTYPTLTDQEKERIFAEDVLGWVQEEAYASCSSCNGTKQLSDVWVDDKGCPRKDVKTNQLWPGEEVFSPLTDLNHAILGLEKLGHQWGMAHGFDGYQVRLYEESKRLCKVDSDNLNEAIVEACIRIKRPDLFEGE